MRIKWKFFYNSMNTPLSVRWLHSFTHYTIFVIFIFCGAVVAQSNMWPYFLTIPELEDTAGQDSSVLTTINKFSFYQTLREENVITWRKADDRYYFDQQSNYKLTMYNRKTQDHFVSLPGMLYKKGFPWKSGNFGIEWVPKLNYKVRSQEKTFQSTVDVGPMYSSQLFSLPFSVNTGISADVWKENITGNAIDAILQDNSSDMGYYAGCRVGDELYRVNGLPLHISLNAIGRSVRNAGLGMWMGNALWANDAGTGDSVFLSVSDSLSNGKESFLDQGTTFSTTPWRIIHGFAAGGGVKAAERFGFFPAGYYRYAIHSVNYPKDTLQINDVRSNSHHVNLQLSSFNSFFFNYSGGIECSWSAQDWVYKSDALPSVIRSSDLNNPRTTKKIETNNNDNTIFNARMDHEVAIPLPGKFEFDYMFFIARESKLYKNYYVSTLSGRADTIRNQMESDGVEKAHHFEVVRNDSGAALSYGLSYDFIKSTINYLRKERSGSSRNRVNHRIRTYFELQLGSFAIKEEFSVQGEKSEFIFKDVHKGGLFDPPPQQRDLNSKLSGSWTFNEHVKLGCEWSERYRDDGEWYGEEYLPDTIAGNYYAIQNMTNDYSIATYAELSLGQIQILIGGSFRDIYSRRYSKGDQAYVSSSIGEGYLFEPYLQWNLMSNAVSVSGRIKRNFNTIDPERWSVYKNWDISLSIQKEW